MSNEQEVTTATEKVLSEWQQTRREIENLRLKAQEAKADKGKPDIYLVPPEIFSAIAYIRMYGNEKYHDPDNWQTVEIERYYSAAMRHLLAWRRGETVDMESGYPHLWHAACNLAFMISLEDRQIAKANDEIMREATYDS